MKLTERTASQVWDVLADVCGASEHGRRGFIQTATTDGITEYRFMGSLGFGGKFRETFKVTCYSEDETPDRLAMIQAANERLAALTPGHPRRPGEE